VIAATNRDLHAAVFDGTFRGDLYARLAEVIVVTPTLRERREDILPILRSALGESAPPLSADLCEALLVHPWPFNIRELRKLATDLRVRGQDLPVLDLDLVRNRLMIESEPSSTPAGEAVESRDAPPNRDELVQLLNQHNGSVADVARATGRSRKQVYRWLEIHGLDPKTFRPG
jgi:sigma-54 dependent transcriptional regulator, acetoin dehydrogenase operon transcriptional activator AcoR